MTDFTLGKREISWGIKVDRPHKLLLTCKVSITVSAEECGTLGDSLHLPLQHERKIELDVTV